MGVVRPPFLKKMGEKTEKRGKIDFCWVKFALKFRSKMTSDQNLWGKNDFFSIFQPKKEFEIARPGQFLGLQAQICPRGPFLPAGPVWPAGKNGPWRQEKNLFQLKLDRAELFI